MSTVSNLIKAYENNQTLHAACELKLFDIISENRGAINIEVLGVKIGCQGSTDRLERFCNLCCSLDLLHKSWENGEAYYSNSIESEKYLVSSSTLCQLGLVLGQKHRHLTGLCYSNIVNSILTGEGSRVSKQNNKKVFNNIFKDKEMFFSFALFMDSWGMTLKEDLQQLGLGGVKHAVDLGGCLGAVGRCLKLNYPDTEVTLADLKEPVEFAPMFPMNKIVKMNYTEVDFFKGSLPKADLYVLGHILHDWDDDKCLHILANVHDALLPGGKILILDCHLNNDKSGPTKACEMDLHMLTYLNGRERTGEEFMTLLEKSGFTGSKLCPLKENPWYDAVIAHVGKYVEREAVLG